IAKNKYIRKAISIGVLQFANPQPGNHAYGAKKPASEIYLAGDWGNDRKVRTFAIDLQKLAPANWSGKVYISAATGFIAPDRRITLKLKRFNQAVQAAEIPLINLADFIMQTKIPRKVDIALQANAADYNSVIKTPLPGKFYKLGLAGFSDAVKVAAVSCNNNTVFAALEVATPQNVNQLEFWLIGSNKKVWQFTAYSDNSSMISCNLQPFADKRVKISVEDQKRFFFAIPRDLLGNGNEFRFNLALYRHGSSSAPGEFATYAALPKSFYDPANFAFGNITSGKSAPKQTPEYTVHNLGKGGYTTGNIIRYRLPQALKLKPQAVVLLAGTNDMLNTGKLATFEQFEKNLRYIVKTLQKNGAEVVMNTLPPCSEKLLLKRHKPEKFGKTMPMARIDQANKIVRKIAAECNCELIDLYDLVISSGDPDSAESLLRNPANVKSSDGVHLRSEGYRFWAEKLSQTSTLKNLPPKSVTVCLGDSLTWGAGMKGAGTVEGETMPAFLKNLMK
ncbi:MAG: SGNH/GDSL hydrolase family protein, partial [Lentisphaeria bacterium]|nr:SGNH/GDSL hydrolase family protein [Lentisphaeria bacterium]